MCYKLTELQAICDGRMQNIVAKLFESITSVTEFPYSSELDFNLPSTRSIMQERGWALRAAKM